MLSSMISEKLIRINVEAADWKEAIRASAQPLLTEDKITQEYIDKIIEIAEETGPYIVVAEHIALPHAPSKYGAKELAMGITVLRTPIEFGNEANDLLHDVRINNTEKRHFKSRFFMVQIDSEGTTVEWD